MQKKVILCVDDEPSILRSLTRLLLMNKYHYILAANGDEALNLLQNNKAQIVLSDYRMPGMTGTEFLKEVSEHYPATIRVILSGYSQATQVQDALNNGEVHHFLEKPWEEKELLNKLSSYFEQYDTLYPPPKADPENATTSS